jgi:FHA domain-containing protein
MSAKEGDRPAPRSSNTQPQPFEVGRARPDPSGPPARASAGAAPPASAAPPARSALGSSPQPPPSGAPPSSSAVPPARPSAGPASRTTWTLIIEDEDGELTRISLSRESYSLGRDPGCDLCLSQHNVSRRHAKLERGPGGGWLLHDLGSRYGSFVNGRRIEGPRALTRYDMVQLGEFLLTFAPANAAATSPDVRALDLPHKGETNDLLHDRPDRVRVFGSLVEATREVRLDKGPVFVGGGDDCAVRTPDLPFGLPRVLIRPLISRYADRDSSFEGARQPPVGPRYEVVDESETPCLLVNLRPFKTKVLEEDDIIEFADHREVDEDYVYRAQRTFAVRYMRRGRTSSEHATRPPLRDVWTPPKLPVNLPHERVEHRWASLPSEAPPPPSVAPASVAPASAAPASKPLTLPPGAELRRALVSSQAPPPSIRMAPDDGLSTADIHRILTESEPPEPLPTVETPTARPPEPEVVLAPRGPSSRAPAPRVGTSSLGLPSLANPHDSEPTVQVAVSASLLAMRQSYPPPPPADNDPTTRVARPPHEDDANSRPTRSRLPARPPPAPDGSFAPDSPFARDAALLAESLLAPASSRANASPFAAPLPFSSATPFAPPPASARAPTSARAPASGPSPASTPSPASSPASAPAPTPAQPPASARAPASARPPASARAPTSDAAPNRPPTEPHSPPAARHPLETGPAAGWFINENESNADATEPMPPPPEHLLEGAAPASRAVPSDAAVAYGEASGGPASRAQGKRRPLPTPALLLLGGVALCGLVFGAFALWGRDKPTPPVATEPTPPAETAVAEPTPPPSETAAAPSAEPAAPPTTAVPPTTADAPREPAVPPKNEAAPAGAPSTKPAAGAVDGEKKAEPAPPPKPRVRSADDDAKAELKRLMQCQKLGTCN